MQGFNSLEFWEYLARLATESQVIIDRPRGSVHPHYPGLTYPLDYGFLEGTTTVDGGGIDVWVGSLAARTLDAVALTVDLHKRDAEVKLLLGCDEAEKQVVMDFLNGANMRAWLVRRSLDGIADPAYMFYSRRSVRRFLPQQVSEEVLMRILEAAAWAPSAHNRQPWRFVVLRSVESRAYLAEAMGIELRRDRLSDGMSLEEAEAQVARSRQRILEAPVAVLLCLDTSAGDSYPDAPRQQAEFLMGVQSVALAGGQLLLAAHAMRLGGVWVCAPLFAPHAARKALNLPDAWQPQALLLLGYPAKLPAPPPRRPIDEVTLTL